MRRSIRSASLAFALSATIAPAAAIPPAAAGVLASDNIDHVVTIPDVNAIGGKIVGDYFYVTTVHGLRIYDVSQGVPILTGALALPHFENEAVDTNGEIALISADFFVFGGTDLNLLVVVDVRNKNAPVVAGVALQHDGHTASCVADCDYVYTSGGEVFDLRDPANPTNLGFVKSGYTHNWNIDATGLAWSDGRQVWDTATPTAPQALIAPSLGIGHADDYGWHNSIRPNASNANLGDDTLDAGELVLGAGEDLYDFDGPSGNCNNDDRVTASWFRRDAGDYVVETLDTWNVGQNGTLPSAKPFAATFCSSHWLDYSNDLVAVGWYEQGTRLLDVSNPRDIQQVGYFMPVETQAWAAYFNEVSEGPFGAGTYVYSIDLVRGIDVFTIDRDDLAPVLAPRLNPTSVAFGPSAEFGWSCRIPAGTTLRG